MFFVGWEDPILERRRRRPSLLVRGCRGDRGVPVDVGDTSVLRLGSHPSLPPSYDRAPVVSTHPHPNSPSVHVRTSKEGWEEVHGQGPSSFIPVIRTPGTNLSYDAMSPSPPLPDLRFSHKAFLVRVDPSFPAVVHKDRQGVYLGDRFTP